MVTAQKGHAWSGWPGAFCLKCGAEHAYENAMALGWVTIDQDPVTETWDTEEHRLEVLRLDGSCPADAGLCYKCAYWPPNMGTTPDDGWCCMFRFRPEPCLKWTLDPNRNRERPNDSDKVP